MLLLFLGLIAFACAQKVRVHDLRTEYLHRPTGIIQRNPRFSWLLTSVNQTRDQYQTAYELFVCDNVDCIGRLIWASGKVLNSKSFLVSYGGPQLNSSTRYFWKVKVYGKEHEPSFFSETTDFITGLMSDTDWSPSQWITGGNWGSNFSNQLR